MTFGPPDPRRVPYYLLIVSDPEQIPFQFQYMLDVQYAVGRIYFDTAEEYASYAHSLVEAERGHLARRRRLVLAGAANPGDDATRISATILVPNLASELQEGTAARGWTIETRPPEQTYKADMLRLMGGQDTPALLFTASHGVAFRNGSPRQGLDQGALLQVFRITRRVWNDKTQAWDEEERYGITSLPAGVASTQRLGEIARQAWGIEHGLHYRRDVTLHEDAAHLRRGDGPQVLAALNNAVIGIVLQTGETNLAHAQRAFDDPFDRFLGRLSG